MFRNRVDAPLIAAHAIDACQASGHEHIDQEAGVASQQSRLGKGSGGELDGQARQLEQSSAGNWRQRARVRAASSRLRLRAGDYLAKAVRFEEAGE